jgi:CxxC motif-containing protein (DUF1111 family)
MQRASGRIFGFTATTRALVMGAAAAAVFVAAAALASGSLDSRDDLSPQDKAKVERVLKFPADFSKPEAFERMSAGGTTSTKLVNQDAFSHSLANLKFDEEEEFKLGNGLFRKTWVSSPSSTQASDGLGPLFNARACQLCHLKDGRGHPPRVEGEALQSMLFRLAVPARTEEEQKALADKTLLRIPDPTYGGQLQQYAVPGLKGEGDVDISYEEIPVELACGEKASLRKPSYELIDLAYGAPDPALMLSPRVAPPMIGLGLVEAIHQADIMALADPDDRNGDGISGEPSMVRDPDKDGLTIGRFGWKASEATIGQQSADAFADDVGISSPHARRDWGDCTAKQPQCLAMATGVQPRLGDTEAPDPVLDLVDFYSRNLAVPARRDIDDGRVLRGKQVFYESGCVSCHHPKYVTRRDAPQKAHQFQLIWPYSDFLLHDMGEGLADNMPVGDASGAEWRTPPLWGIGLTETVSGHTLFLHDGRARNLLEAILWHGGEAEAARDKVVALPPEDRAALIRFLESL